MIKSETFKCDCMELMARYPDKHFDLAIVDPPYGISISQDLSIRGKSCRKNGYREWEYKEWDSAIPNMEYFKEIFRVSKNQVIWGGNYFTDSLPPSRCWLIWDKGQRDFSFADGELAWTSFNSSVRIFDYSRGKLLADGKIHPTQKPVALYEWILMNYAQDIDKMGGGILDTHLGSGSSRIACHNFGINFTGCELDKDYFDAQEKRFANHIAQLRMF